MVNGFQSAFLRAIQCCRRRDLCRISHIRHALAADYASGLHTRLRRAIAINRINTP